MALLPLRAEKIALILLLTAACGHSGPLDELSKRQADAKNGYIHLDDTMFSQVNRDLRNGKFSLFIIFDVVGHEQMPRAYMEPWLKEFNIASKSYEAHRDRSTGEGLHRVFFCYMDFSDSEKTFMHLDVRNLPHVKFLSSETGDKGQACKMENLEGKAEAFLDCLNELSGLPVGPVHRPRSWQEILGPPLAITGVIIFLIAASRLVVLTKRTTHMPLLDLLCCIGAILVYVVSISGMMYTIINKMPWYYWREGQFDDSLVVILRSDEQLGAEGLGFGILYTLAGLTLAFIVNVAPSIHSKAGQRLLSYFCLASSAMCMYVVYFYQEWKRSQPA